MKGIKITKERIEKFANDILPILKELDFTCKTNNDDYDMDFERDGYIYHIRFIYFSSNPNRKLTELRFCRRNGGNKDYQSTRREDILAESCWVYLDNGGFPKKYPKKYVYHFIDGFVINHYRIILAEKNYCNFCDSSCKDNLKKHNKGINHIKNVQKYDDEVKKIIFEKTPLCNDVINEILTY